MEAARELQARRAGADLSADRVYDLVLAATGNKDAAEKAFRDFRWQELKSGRAVKE